MIQYNTLNVKFSSSHFNKLKSGIKYGTEVTQIQKFHQMLLVILMIKIILRINCY